MMERETRIAFINSYSRFSFVQTNAQVVQLPRVYRLTLLHRVPALEILMAVHPKQGSDQNRSSHDLP